jgi:hypothetical protein
LGFYRNGGRGEEEEKRRRTGYTCESTGVADGTVPANALVISKPRLNSANKLISQK